MSGKSVEFLFDFGSPAAYLASTQLPRICEETGATLIYRPMLLGGVFKATGNIVPSEIPAKFKYLFIDLARCAKRFGVPFKLNPHFPVNTVLLMRIATGALQRQPERFPELVTALYQAVWVDGKAMADPAVVAATLREAGFDADALIAMAAETEVKDALRVATEAAVARGVFGAPTMFVGDDMYFGQDRLDFVRAALAA